MKQIVKDILFGILIIIVITILEFIVTIPFGDPGDISLEGYSYLINRELLLTALPAFLVTFVFAWLLKTKSRTEALRRSITWTIIIFLNYLIIGIGNAVFGIIFSALGIYVLLICAFAGPVVFTKIKKLKK